ncbi:hypothetical protein [Sphingomonas colocasiae]|uniref:Uncharacterized protein n=1 Tax=Sphingomonas colocasiae TaxID=1848973 RepID=A0ABS7PY40_9SPHN|nr:hypothetical protein [Sphingomonas colocasiae]MBY8826066.1 hypothetical protein [Sphingomonas colocasiae]
MQVTMIALTLGGMALAAPAIAHDSPAPGDPDNAYWRDYQTDLSEARRELASDLRRARKPSDREEAWTEYRRELADARSDYRKEMIEKGYAVGTVQVLEDAPDN